MMRALLILLLLGAAGGAWWYLRPVEELAPETPETPAVVRTPVNVPSDGDPVPQQAAMTPARAAALDKNDAAMRALEEGRIEEAAALFAEAVELDTNDEILALNLSRARVSAGVAALGEGRLVVALKWFDDAAEAHLDQGTAAWWKARLLMQQAQRDAAKEVLDTALREFPKEPTLLRMRADLAWLAGDLPEAVRLLDAAVAAAPDDAGMKSRRDQLVEEQRAFSSYLTDATAYFDVRYDPNDRALVSALPDLRAELDKVYMEVVGEIGLRPQQRLLVLFLNPARFGESAPEWSAALYDGRIRLMVHDPVAQRRQLISTLRHELTHAVLHSLGPGVPTWLHEGLAQQQEGRSVEAARQTLEQGLTLDPAELGQDWTAWKDRDKVRQAYAYALSLVDWLPTRFGENAVQNLLYNLPGRGFEDAWDLGFTRPWAEVELEHRRFLQGD